MEINLACVYATMINLYFVCTFGQDNCRYQPVPSEVYYVGNGFTVPFSCRRGYYLDGPSEGLCVDGELVPEGPTCLPFLGCTRPISMDIDLSLSPNKSIYESGDVITYSCKEGTRLRGTMSATCSESGLYPSDVPECLGNCIYQTPSEFHNVGHGSTIPFSCQSGYYFDGPSEGLCVDGEVVPEGPTCLRNLKCHTWEQTVCEPSGPECNRISPTNVDKQRSVVTCDDNVRFCYVYQVSASGGGVTSFNSNVGGCVDNEQLDMSYGCHNGSFSEILDSPFESKFSDQGTYEAKIYFCNSELCNESVETASSNNAAIISPLPMILVFGSMIWCLSL